MIKLTVVMPAFNEAERIYRNLIETADQIEKFLDDYRILAVNDGSTDNTKSEIKRAMGRNPKIGMISYTHNRGKGYAVRRGLAAARSEYAAFLDSDLELPPYLLENLLKIAEDDGADVVIGSKMHPESKIEYPFFRKVMSFGYYFYLKLLFGMKIHDTQTGIKLFKMESIIPVLKNVHSERFSFDIDILANAATAGLEIKEAPVVVNFSRNKKDRSKIKISTIFQMVADTLRIRIRLGKNEIYKIR